MKPEPEPIIVRCLTCNVGWDMDADPAKCRNERHPHSLNGGPPVDGDGLPVVDVPWVERGTFR